MSKIMEINDFADECGYFYNACVEKNISINNGYNCRHSDQSQKQEGIGKCYCWSCPLGYEADEEDFKNPEIDNDGYTLDDFEEMTYIVIGK